MKLFLLISTLAVVYCRPQSKAGNENTHQIEIEEQKLIELHPAGRSQYKSNSDGEIARMTQDILQKIDEVNKKHGYAPKTVNFNKNIDIPHFYSYTNDQPKPLSSIYNSQFINNPLINNPVNGYIQQQSYENENNKFKNDVRYQPRYHAVTSDNSLPEDVIPGQYITRKITHHESYIMPSKFTPIVNSYEVFQPNLYKDYSGKEQTNLQSVNSQHGKNNNIQKKLEKQTIESVKNIIMNSQLTPNIQETRVFNPLVQNVPYNNPYVQYPVYNNPNLLHNNLGYVNSVQNMPWNVYKQIDSDRTTQYTNNMASISPNLMMYNAVTTLIEYGQPKDCVSDHHKIKNIARQLDVKNKDSVSSEISSTDGENISQNRKEKDIHPNLKKTKSSYEKSATIRNPLQVIIHGQHLQEETEDVGEEIEVDDFNTMEMEKDLKRDHNKKLFSRDNSGNGIFIHKLKVRKGGVAIAGPGGIATAGTGGTAIVGPNGLVYTHPDSLAIAGVGSKVIAVDPSISLRDVIKGTKIDSSTPRIGKVVAVGPVIYYNSG